MYLGGNTKKYKEDVSNIYKPTPSAKNKSKNEGKRKFAYTEDGKRTEPPTMTTGRVTSFPFNT